MFQMLGGAAGYVQLRATDPELCVEIQRIFNAKLESEPYDQIASLCQQRITQIQQVAELAPDPTLLTGLTIEPVMQQVVQIGPGVIDPPIAMEEPAHNLKAKWLSEWLDEDQGQEAGPVLRGCVILLVRYHFQLRSAARCHGISAGSNPNCRWCTCCYRWHCSCCIRQRSEPCTRREQ